jgi:hypothetical protein
MIEKIGGENAFWNYILNRYVQNAKKRNYEFKLSLGQLKNICSQNCGYCGRPPKEDTSLFNNKLSKANRRGHVFDEDYARTCIVKMNGVDRVDNSIGYIVENCVSCCGTCNRAKDTMSRLEFLNWIKEIYEHTIAPTN